MSDTLSNPLSPDVLLARQPIFDRNMRLYGYELLFRQNNAANSADFLCGNKATASLLLNAYASLSQATEHHRVPAFINVTDGLLTGTELLPVNPDMVVLEILENVVPNQALIDSIVRYQQLGFKFALDDYPFTPEFEPLIEHADYIKVDVLSLDMDKVTAKLNHLKNYDCHLLAEKVEDREMYVKCLKMGFHLFQGYFFERPQIVRGKQLSSSKLAVMKLFGIVYDQDSHADDIAELVSQDPSLSYRLLKIINSAAYGLPRTVQSIKEAVVFLGLDQLRRWVSILALAGEEDVPQEFIRTLLVRARSCELLASEQFSSQQDQCFTAGLFSGIDNLMGADLDFLLSELPLADEINQAILQYHGDIGWTLKVITSLEHADWDQLPSNLEVATLNQIYFDAIQWCDDITATIYP